MRAYTRAHARTCTRNARARDTVRMCAHVRLSHVCIRTCARVRTRCNIINMSIALDCVIKSVIHCGIWMVVHYIEWIAECNITWQYNGVVINVAMMTTKIINAEKE